MSYPHFSFKQFSIQQNNCPMKISIDSVLLGAWASINANASQVLDIGTGTGILALMVAQQHPHLHITAIEPHEVAYHQALQNIAASPWANRVKVLPHSLQTTNPPPFFDAFIANPPYFSKSKLPAKNDRALARHTVNLNLNSLFYYSGQLAQPQAVFYLILPIAQQNQLLFYAQKNQWCIQHIIQVITRQGKPPARILVELKKQEPASAISKNPLVSQICLYHQNGQPTAIYKNLTKAFYLAF